MAERVLVAEIEALCGSLVKHRSRSNYHESEWDHVDGPQCPGRCVMVECLLVGGKRAVCGGGVFRYKGPASYDQYGWVDVVAPTIVNCIDMGQRVLVGAARTLLRGGVQYPKHYDQSGREHVDDPHGTQC